MVSISAIKHTFDPVYFYWIRVIIDESVLHLATGIAVEETTYGINLYHNTLVVFLSILPISMRKRPCHEALAGALLEAHCQAITEGVGIRRRGIRNALEMTKNIRVRPSVQRDEFMIKNPVDHGVIRID